MLEKDFKNFKNLTPHPITILTKQGPVTLDPVKNPMCVSCTRTKVEEIDGVEIFSTEFGQVENKPWGRFCPWCGTLILEIHNKTCWSCHIKMPTIGVIVTRVVKNALDATDPDLASVCVVPDDIVRDKEGKTIGCRAFSR